MIKRILWLFLAVASVAHAAAFEARELKPLPQQTQAARLVAQVLSRHHYKAMPLDDAMSEKIFDLYLKSLDSEKLFFVQSDIDQLSPLRTKLDDAIRDEDLSAPFAVFNLYIKRASERFSYARSLLKAGFEFRKEESFQYDRTKEPWAKSETEMRDLWRRRVKNDWLRLKLAGKGDKSVVETLDRRYDHFVKRMSRLKSEDVFQTFMNAYTMAIEPHTNYLGPRAAEDFDISMRLSLVGIGAVLADKDDYTTIRELVPGGPAALSSELQVGDRIVGVAQGKDGVMTDVMGWRLDETVTLIRGAVDSTVGLDILPANAGPDGNHHLVSLVRKKIALEEQAAKKSVIAVTDGHGTRRIGVIVLPTFYEDFEARQKGMPDFKSATRDVARLLRELKDEHVDAVLMDLRNNGGGSLSEAIKLTGLFVGAGPVVQQRDATGAIKVWSNSASTRVWDGPLGVLINRGSASASEIFAAAIQDYGRGFVIGEPSFGKGTVQTVLNLDDVAKNDKPQYGELKFTIAQFFRINGGTTQLRGVTPDFVFPIAKIDNFGESSFDNALPWMQVKAVGYAPADDLKAIKPALLTRSQEREKSDKDFVCLRQNIAEVELQQQKNRVPLNEVERRREQSTQEARLKSCETGSEATRKNARGELVRASGAGKSLQRDDGLQADERNLVTELANEKARKNAKDVLLTEAAHILGDEVNVFEPQARFAARDKPNAPLVPNRKQGADAARPGVW